MADKKTDAEKAAQEAAETQAARNQIDADFRTAVADATKKRSDALAELDPASTNVGETAWNETKADEDPEYAAVTGTFRAKLDEVVNAVRTTGNADVVGLEAFEARVRELLIEQGVTPGAVAVPGQAVKDQIADENADTDTDSSAKKGKLPDDFPHRAQLEAAGVTTYAQARKLGGDYSEIEGVGEARGKEIDAAL